MILLGGKPMSDTSREQFRERIDAIESGYEFMLAYAAQGLDREAGPAGSQIRDYLLSMATALNGLAERCGAVASSMGRTDGIDGFLDVLEADASKAGAAVSLVLAQPSISSQLIDNFNASIHLRALLTDLFLIDEALKPSVQ